MITGIAHVNILVPPGTLDAAEQFYSKVLGFTSVPVPAAGVGRLLWFDITPQGQQVHVAHGTKDSNIPLSSRHPCFKVASPEALLELRKRVWEAHKAGTEAAPLEADEPGKENSGAQGVEFPSRFFARDYAGNRLEFSL